MTALISKIAELKQENAILENLANRVSTLENMPDEAKKELVEYLHDFNVTDKWLHSLSDDQISFHNDCVNYLKHFEKVLASKQVVVDENVINDIKNLVEVQTGFNLRDYVTDVQRNLITKAFSDLADMQQQQLDNQQQIINGQQEILDRQNAIIDRMDELDNRASDYVIDIVIILLIIGGFALLLTIPSYILAIDHHPKLTSIGIIIALLLCTFAGYSAFHDGGNSNDN